MTMQESKIPMDYSGCRTLIEGVGKVKKMITDRAVLCLRLVDGVQKLMPTSTDRQCK